MSTVSRTYHISRPPGLSILEGIPDDDVEVFSLDPSPICFKAEGKTKTDDFYIELETWKRLGQPTRIEITVQAIQ